MTQSLFDEFRWRGLLYDSSEGTQEALAKEKLTGYNGFDPSAASLHAGNLIPIMGLVHLQRYGHSPIAIVGGGTGLIGDPGGKTTERKLLTRADANANVAGIREQLGRFLDFNARSNPARLINNADWLCTVNLIDFLRDVGKHFTVNAMIAKESVKARMEGEGISFTEFSYMLLQAYDFLMLYEKYHCTLQAGGREQWGNITAGIELIRRVHGVKAYGVVYPLLTTASGQKYGKSETGAVWLDANRTSPFRFYQFWFNQDDRDVIASLKYFTLLPQPEIEALAQSLAANPEKRESQRALARAVTRMVHGDSALANAEKASAALFGGEVGNLNARDVLDIFAEAPSTHMEKAGFGGDGMPLADVLTAAGLAKSKGEARRLIEAGGVYLNNVRAADAKRTITLKDTIEGQVLILRKGQKEYRLVRVG